MDAIKEQLKQLKQLEGIAKTMAGNQNTLIANATEALEKIEDPAQKKFLKDSLEAAQKGDLNVDIFMENMKKHGINGK